MDRRPKRSGADLREDFSTRFESAKIISAFSHAVDRPMGQSCCRPWNRPQREETMAAKGREPNSVDQTLPPAKLATLGLQHVLVMYAGAVAVPLIIAGALGLPAEQRAVLISADILACGLASLVQSRHFRLGRADARADRRRQGSRRRGLPSDLAAAHRLRRGHQRRACSLSLRRAHELTDPSLSCRRHRLDHSRHRRVADADRRRLGRGAAHGSSYRRRRLQGHDCEPEPRRARRIRPVADRAPRHSRRQQVRQGVSSPTFLC
jgi:Permease family